MFSRTSRLYTRHFANYTKRVSPYRHSTSWSRPSLFIAACTSSLLLVLSKDKVYTDANADKSVHVKDEISPEYCIPVSLQVASTPLRLVGFGTRSVTFLSFHVYSIAFYNKTGLKCEVVTDLVNDDPIAIRLRPTRPTNGSHLRKGFVKLFQKRLQMDRHTLTAQEVVDVEKGMQALDASFATGVVSRDVVFVFSKVGNTLRIEQDGSEIFTIANGWMARNFFLGYFTEPYPSPSFVEALSLRRTENESK